MTHQSQNLGHPDTAIKVWGERLNSPHPERRKLFIDVSVSDPPLWVRTDIDLLKFAIGRINTLLVLFAPRFPNSMPWWFYVQCPNCRRRFDASFARGLGLHTITWRNQLCMRHGILVNNKLFSLDNKERSLAVYGTRFVYEASTNKYAVKFTVSGEYADAEITKLDSNRTLVFRYRNHTNSYPYMSSYAYLISKIASFLYDLQRFIVDCYHGINVYINGTQICPAVSDTPAIGSTFSTA